MKSRATRLAFAIGLALARGARGEDTFDALLLGSNEVPGPGLADGSILAVLSVDGTNVSLSLTLKGLKGWMAAHIHKGAAGRTGKLVVDFPWSSWPKNSSSTLFASASAKLAADLVANPQRYYVHVHTPGFPSGAARGQLTARPKADPAVAPPSGETSGVFFLHVANLDQEEAAFADLDSSIHAESESAEAAPGEAPQPSSIGKADQTIRFRSLSFKVYRDPDFTLEASATSRLRVNFTASGDCSVSGSTVHLPSAGKCWVTAHQPGNERFNAAPDVEQRITIEKASQTIGGVAPQPKTYLDPDFPLNMTASSGLPIVWVESGDCAVSGSYVHILGAGHCSLTAHQPGDSNFTTARIVDLEFTIAKADQTISLGEFLDPVYGERDLPLIARATSGLPVSVTAWGSCWITGSFMHIIPGSCTLTAQQPGNVNFNAAPSVTQTFTILGPD